MKKLTCLAMWLLAVQHVNARHLQLIFQNTDDYNMTGNQPVLINKKLIFNGSVDGQLTVWALDTETLEKETLLQGITVPNNNNVSFQRMGSALYFVAYKPDDLIFNMWKTDGTLPGTTTVTGAPLFSTGLYQNNGFLYGLTDDRKPVVTDGLEYTVHDVNLVNLNSTCVLDTDNIIVHTNNSDDTPFKQSKEGVVTTLAITYTPPIGEFEPPITYHNGACFTRGSGGENQLPGENLWKIDPSGDLTLLNEVIDNQRVLQLMSHQNNLYAIVFAEQSTIIKRLSEDLSKVDATFGAPLDHALSVNGMRSLGEQIAIRRSTLKRPPLEPFVTFTSGDLTEIPGSKINFINLPTPHQTTEQLVLKTVGAQSNLLLSPFEPEEVTIDLPESRLVDIITDDEHPQVYVKTTPVIGDSKLYVVQDTPDIRNILTGSWFNPAVENQGLNIIVGTRANGSQYVNLTGYTYREGLPLWFAGNTDLAPAQKDIDIELFEFSGIGMFEADLTPDRDRYGMINIEMAGCDQLNADITSANETFDLLLYRIDDVTYTENCID